MRSKITTKGAKEKATRLHSKIVRAAGRCASCGEQDYSKLQCAHIVSRRYSATRTDLGNAIALCYRCHIRFTEWPLEWARFVESEIGAATYEALKKRAHTPTKVDWLAEVERLQQVWNEIERQAAA